MIPWNRLQGRGGLGWDIVVVYDRPRIAGFEGVELKAQKPILYMYKKIVQTEFTLRLNVKIFDVPAFPH